MAPFACCKCVCTYPFLLRHTQMFFEGCADALACRLCPPSQGAGAGQHDIQGRGGPSLRRDAWFALLSELAKGVAAACEIQKEEGEGEAGGRNPRRMGALLESLQAGFARQVLSLEVSCLLVGVGEGVHPL